MRAWNGPLEWNIVVEVLARTAARRSCRTLRFGAGRARRPRLATAACASAPTAVTTAFAALAVEHLHFIGHDLGAVAVLAFLVLPLAGSDAALDVHLGTLAQILARHFRQASEQRHPVPFRALLPFVALLVLEGLRGRHADVGHCSTAG